MYYKFYRKNDPGNGEPGGAPQPKVIIPVDPDEMFEKAKVGDFSGPPKPDPNQVEGADLSELDDKLAKAKPIVKEEEINETTGKPKGENTDDEPGDDDGVLKLEPSADDLEEEIQWSGLAKELEIGELKAETYEDFVEKFKEYRDSLTDPTYVNLDAIKTKFGEEAHNVLVALQEGDSSFFNIAEVVQPYYDVAAMEPEEMIRAVQTANKKSEAWINKYIDELKEDGKLETEAEVIRSRAIQRAGELFEENANKLRNFANSTITNKLAAEKSERELIAKEIQQRSEFLGLKLDQKARDLIAKRVNEGYYSKAVNDAKLKADIIIQKEFGQKAIEALQKRNQSAGVKAYQKGLHNLDDAKSQAAKKSGSASGGGEQPEVGSGFGAIRTKGATEVVRA